jgi:VanZ family protein
MMIRYLLSVRQYVRVIMVVLYLSCIVALSLLPPNDLPQVKLFPGFDKIVHFLMYFPLSALLCWNLKTEQKGHYVIWIIFAAVLWGIFMELMQLTMHMGRTFSWFDELANFVGVIFGAAFYWMTTLKVARSE